MLTAVVHVPINNQIQNEGDPVSIAVAESLTADQLAQIFTVYPSMSGSVAEAARRLHRV